MKFKNALRIAAVMLLISIMSVNASAHPGRTDANGGHYNRKTGEYHYHNGGSGSGSGNKTANSASSYSAVKQKQYATRVSVSNMPSKINAGDKIKLKGSAYPSNAEDSQIYWKSSDTSVAVVDSDGNLTAVGVGKVQITASTARGTSAKYNLNVTAVKAEKITIKNKADELYIDESVTLSAAVSPDNATDKEISWRSEDESIATVDSNGRLTALQAGKTVITAFNNDLSDSFELTVKPILAESVRIVCKDCEESEEIRLEVNSELTLSAVILPENTTDKSVKWSLSDTDKAKIDSNGRVTAISAGKLKATAETAGGASDTVELEIYSQKTGGKIAFAVLFLIALSAAAYLLYINKRKR